VEVRIAIRDSRFAIRDSRFVIRDWPIGDWRLAIGDWRLLYRARRVPPRKMVCGFLTIRALCA
jgi:hypothetical protein